MTLLTTLLLFGAGRVFFAALNLVLYTLLKSETRDTVFFDLRTPEDKVMMALKMILVKVGLSGISFVLDVKEETLLVTEIQLDEMWSFVKRKISKKAIDKIETDKLFVQKWTPKTPGKAAGTTDHVLTFRELLTAKFYNDL